MTTNEILTRAAEVLERSVTLENQTLAAELRRFDTAQREALARVEAELKATDKKLLAKTGAHEFVKHGVNRLVAERDTARAQLAKAVGLLWFIQGYLEEGQDSHVKSKIRSFISRHRLDEYAQAEQQEAQGAQAGDEWSSFLNHWLSGTPAEHRPMIRKSMTECRDEGQLNDAARKSWEAWQARAALATQPAVGELEIIATLEVLDYFPNSSVSRPDLHFLWAITPQRQRELVKTIKEPIKLVALTAPPAATHGDDAVLWELLDKSVYGSDEQQVVARAKIRRLLAMRAQGDGEVQ